MKRSLNVRYISTITIEEQKVTNNKGFPPSFLAFPEKKEKLEMLLESLLKRKKSDYFQFLVSLININY